jgi:HSP20 family protein
MAKPQERQEKKEIRKPTPPSSLVAARTTRPLSPFATWERAMDRWFDDFRRRAFPSLSVERAWPFGEAGELPAVDVHETDAEIVVRADVPGVSKDEIQVELRDMALIIKGERKKEEEVKEQDYYRCERSHGSFSRVIGLPTDVKADAIKASFKDGVLEIHLPKSEEAKRKSVKVKVQ